VALLRTASTVTTPTVTSTETAGTVDVLTYGDLTSAPTTTTFIADQNTADALAAYLASTSAADAPIVRIKLDNDSDARLEVMRDLELNQRVIATEAITGAQVDGFVEQITHKITAGGLRHELEIVVGARTRMVGVYSPDSPADPYDLSVYAADNPAEPPPYATYGF
jgi:hypothetical protein